MQQIRKKCFSYKEAYDTTGKNITLYTFSSDDSTNGEQLTSTVIIRENLKTDKSDVDGLF